jgi:hypothetical protein
MTASPVRAQETGDHQRGLSLARPICSECHAIQAQQLKPTPHARMPMLRLTAEQRADIITFILSLRQSGSQPGKRCDMPRGSLIVET